MKINEILCEWADPGPPCKFCGKTQGQHQLKVVRNKPGVSYLDPDQEWNDVTFQNAEDHEYTPVKGYKKLTQDEAKRIGFDLLSGAKAPKDIYQRIANVRKNPELSSKPNLRLVKNEAHPNQQISVYNPNSIQYKKHRVDSYNSADIFSKKEAVPIDQHHLEFDQLNNPKKIDQLDLKELQQAIRADFKHLSPREQKVLNMRFFNDMTLQEVADSYNVTITAIRQVQERAFRKLKEIENGKMRDHATMAEAYVTAKEKKHNPDVKVGMMVAVKDPRSQHTLSFGKFIRIGKSGLAYIKLNAPLEDNGIVPYHLVGQTTVAVPQSWLHASVSNAWPDEPWLAKKKAELAAKASGAKNHQSTSPTDQLNLKL